MNVLEVSLNVLNIGYPAVKCRSAYSVKCRSWLSVACIHTYIHYINTFQHILDGGKYSYADAKGAIYLQDNLIRCRKKKNYVFKKSILTRGKIQLIYYNC